MCGILGSINLSFDNELLDSIKHRGPDDKGIESFSVNGHEVYLGQRRLSIIDLSSAGHQPMTSNCGMFTIIFNGEIYNHEELKVKLQSSIHFKGHSDTESILYYFREFGFQAIKDLNGIFSIAFLDQVNKKLFLARDPFGVKPLYYNISEQSNQLLFSSEIRPIQKELKIKNINLNALASLLKLRYNAAPETIFENIFKLKPGHYLEVDLKNSEIKIKNIPFLNPVPETKNFNSFKEAKDQYRILFDQAVKSQLLSDVPIGILLSGGVDSAMVAATAQKFTPNKLKAFTIGFEGDHYEDEIEDARISAEILGLDHHVKKINFEDFLSIFKKCSKIVEEPLGTTSLIPMYFLSELASQHVKVVLTGQGADEPLGGYPKYKSEILNSKIPIWAQKIGYKLFSQFNFKNEKIKRGINTLGIEDDLSRFLKNYELFNNQDILELINIHDTQSINKIKYYYDVLECKKKTHSSERLMALDSRMNLADDLLNYTDKITMNFALECRVPLLDLKLVEYIESLPYNFRLNLTEGKIIHKEYAKELLPKEIIFRKKKGFQSPTNYWFKSNSILIKEILNNENNIFSKIFNLKKVNEIIAQHENGYSKEKQIFLLLSTCFLLEDY